MCVTLWWIGPWRFVPCRWTVWRGAPRTAKVGARCFRLQQTSHTLLGSESSTAFRYRAQGNLKGAIRYVMHCIAVHIQLYTHNARWVLSCTESTARPWPLIHATSSPSLTVASWYTCTAFVPRATQPRCSLTQTTPRLQFLKGRKYPQAFADFSRAVELEPGNAYVRYNLGVCMLVNQARKRHVCCTSTECLTFPGPPHRS